MDFANDTKNIRELHPGSIALCGMVRHGVPNTSIAILVWGGFAFEGAWWFWGGCAFGVAVLLAAKLSLAANMLFLLCQFQLKHTYQTTEDACSLSR